MWRPNNLISDIDETSCGGLYADLILIVTLIDL